MVATRKTNIVQLTAQGQDAVMDDVNPSPTVHAQLGTAEDGKTYEENLTSDAIKEVSEENALAEPVHEENNLTKKVNPTNAGPFAPEENKGKGKDNGVELISSEDSWSTINLRRRLDAKRENAKGEKAKLQGNDL
uniref:Uncharacterized protein n=1 Tax=Cannabis sativa TaxID=3483 RepID=A0A803PHE2_CANSA